MRLKATLAKFKPRRIPKEIQGYSLSRILLFGLILPATVAAFMTAGMVLAFMLGWGLLAKFAVLALTTILGFTAGTLLILKLYNRMLSFAKVRKEMVESAR